MARWIDADDVASAIYHHFPSVRTMADARGVIDEAPSIDIVRCKECNNADFSGCPKGRCYCMNHSSYVNADDFCSYGERIEQ